LPEVPEFAKNPKVFVSYSHDDAAHKRRVLEFADRLRDCGIDAILDQDETFPAQGWPAWCKRQIEDADHVLLVCTEAYRRRIDGREADGEGLGVCWEAPIIQQLLYNAGGRGSRRVIPVLFAGGTAACIPTEVQRFARFIVDREDGFEDLCRVLFNKPRRLKRPVGTAPALPPEERPWLAPAPTQRPNTADSERRSAENDKRLRKLKGEIAKILSNSKLAMETLQGALGARLAAHEEHVGGAAALVGRLMSAEFSIVQLALVEAHEGLREQERNEAVAAIEQVSSFLLPWLYIAGMQIDEQWWGAYLGGDIVTLPAGLATMAEIVIAGLERRRVFFESGRWPSGKYSMTFPEDGIPHDVEDFVRRDLSKKFEIPGEYKNATNDDKDKSIANELEYFEKEGRKPYLICRDRPERQPDRRIYEDKLRRLSNKYKGLCVIELDNLFRDKDQLMFNDIRQLLHSMEG